MTFEEWLATGVTAGWVSLPVCQTHEGSPMTNEEMEILQARADARPQVSMRVLLTDREKANLRRREVADREIGS